MNKPRKRAPISNKVAISDDSVLPTEVEDTRIKMESLDMTQSVLMENKIIPKDLYEPSFNSRKSVS